MDGVVSPAFWPHPRGVLEVVSVPVFVGLERPDVLGVLSIGYLLDDVRASQFKALTGADIAFAMDGAVRASTLGPGAAPALATVLASTRPTRLVIGGVEYVAQTQPLGDHEPARASRRPSSCARAASGCARSAASRRRSAPSRFGATLLAIVVSYGVARTITRPLATITDHMRQVAATGDLTRKIATKRRGGWDDDDAHVLATTFNTLTDSIARFQREAGAARAAVVARPAVDRDRARSAQPADDHQGRAAAADRNGTTAADVRDAAEDIDEEIERLNRLVNDVLDFARPIRFDPAPTDVNAVCRDAAAAAVGRRRHAPVTLDLAPGAAGLDHRQRAAAHGAVNLLTNAQHARSRRKTRRPGRARRPRPCA